MRAASKVGASGMASRLVLVPILLALAVVAAVAASSLAASVSGAAELVGRFAG